jgi:intein-encoded DNA endonuclease-like protein
MHIEVFLNDSFSFLLEARKNLTLLLKNKELFFPFLAGFSDAEGCFGITNKKAYFSIGNYDYNVLQIIRIGLIERGVDVPRIYSDKKLYISCEGYQRNNYYHHLRISRKDALASFLDHITPFIRHDDKKQRLLLVKQHLLERKK